MESKKHDYFFLMFAPFFIGIGIQMILGLFVGELLVMYKFITFKGGMSFNDFYDTIYDTILYSNLSDYISLAYAVLAIIIFWFIYKSIKGTKLRGSFKGISSKPLYMVCGIVILAVSLQFVSNAVISAVSSVFPQWLIEYQELKDAAGLTDTISVAMAIYAFVLGPIAEELAFRGVTMCSAKKIMPYQAAIVVQAFLFACYHMNKLQGVYVFVVGLAFGYVAHKYNSLIPSIALHILYNILGTFISLIAADGEATVISYFSWLLLALIATYIGLLLVKNSASDYKDSDQVSDN